MSAKGNRTIAIVNGSEGYETIKEAFGSIFEEINMISTGKLSVNDKEINMDFFILLMLGLKGATSNYACAGARYTKAIAGKLRNIFHTTIRHPCPDH